MDMCLSIDNMQQRINEMNADRESRLARAVQEGSREPLVRLESVGETIVNDGYIKSIMSWRYVFRVMNGKEICVGVYLFYDASITQKTGAPLVRGFIKAPWVKDEEIDGEFQKFHIKEIGGCDGMSVAKVMGAIFRNYESCALRSRTLFFRHPLLAKYIPEGWRDKHTGEPPFNLDIPDISVESRGGGLGAVSIALLPFN